VVVSLDAESNPLVQSVRVRASQIQHFDANSTLVVNLRARASNPTSQDAFTEES
jgi:hypothetical protein